MKTVSSGRLLHTGVMVGAVLIVFLLAFILCESPPGPIRWGALLVAVASSLILGSFYRRPLISALRENEERYRKIVETAQEGVWLLDTDTNTVLVNQCLARMLRYTPEEMVGRSFAEFVGADSVESAAVHLARTTRLATDQQEFQLRRKDGSLVWVLMSTGRMHDAAGKVTGAVAMVVDLTERKEAERRLERNEHLYRSAIETAGAVVYYRNHNTNTFEFVSRGVESLTGYPPEEFTPDLWDSLIREVVLRGDFETLSMEEARRAIEQGEFDVWRADYRIIARDGTERWVANAALQIHGKQPTPVASLGILQDITQRKRMEEQLRRAAKLEAVGTLAGGIAHEFNNLLMGIIGYTHFLREAIHDRNQVADLAEICKLADHGSKLTQQLLAFGRKQRLDTELLDLNAHISHLCRMLPKLIGEHIDIQFSPGPGLARIRADAGQIDQVLVNLAVNARDAMLLGGTLSIRTGDVMIDEEQIKDHPGATPGPYVELCVSDDGCGMDAETLAHVFEPFYTTKEVGRGTGLGLASVYGIVKQHRGHITVDSTEGKGTAFHIFLPAAKNGSNDTHHAADTPPVLAKGAETILVVEDETTVRKVVARALERRGYKVRQAATADEGEAALDRESPGIDLLLTDIVMPGSDGHELFRRLAARHPDLKVLFMTGYDDQSAIIRHVKDSGLPFIHKPIDMNVLAAKVRETLDA